MLGWIKGSSSSHALDRKDAKAVLTEELARLNPVAALDELAGYLNDIKTTESLRPKTIHHIQKCVAPQYQKQGLRLEVGTNSSSIVSTNALP